MTKNQKLMLQAAGVLREARGVLKYICSAVSGIDERPSESSAAMRAAKACENMDETLTTQVLTAGAIKLKRKPRGELDVVMYGQGKDAFFTIEDNGGNGISFGRFDDEDTADYFLKLHKANRENE